MPERLSPIPAGAASPVTVITFPMPRGRRRFKHACAVAAHVALCVSNRTPAEREQKLGGAFVVNPVGPRLPYLTTEVPTNTNPVTC